ncbi:sigma-70 family RNA polymerase sigma factor [Stieleria sp. JC731]|uniref:sigma-70 family RNA polymerase sigma factor n=1 Tax=Pirellulaceae TaxID=2691357 RepID=UPI001E52FCBC|nr:sigma-70 family RNA polymerase sigma factor [Stieleria sp. JC731]MCC9600971.1 sigma-70 family RNA polymerase sigma factor [Stieleria sp. JC731]
MEPDSEDGKEFQESESITDRPDGWLLRQWKSGDEQAAEVIFDRYAFRLVALVASRLNHRYRSQIDPDAVMQSAMGSFFDAARHSRIQVSRSVSLWRLLATFARRKLARSIERHSASKRGGEQTQVSLDQAFDQPQSVSSRFSTVGANYSDADELLDQLRAELPADQFSVVDALLAGLTQQEIAKSLGIDERTVRRRMARVRETLSPMLDVVDLVKDPQEQTSSEGSLTRSTTLPRVNYNGFVLGKLIGSGGFGKVYRASMQSDGCTVAVKFLRKAFWQNDEARESFIREINAASRINHPSVIRYLGYGESPHGGPYVLSEWIDGRPMHAIDRPSERVSKKRFLHWLRQICEALQAVHDAGLVHGDLSPANVLIDNYDRVTITDFGFSQVSAGATSPILGGTLGFAAPEQIDPAFGIISQKTDIYAIGGLIHWYLTGAPPNAGDGTAETLMKTIDHQRPNYDTSSPMNANFQRILRRSLVSSPADRTISLSEISCLISTVLPS